MLEFGLSGKTALITGGASGIGRAIAVALAGQGVSVALADRHDCSETEAEIRALGVDAISFNVELSAKVQVDGMVDRVLSHVGGLDLFVNNAGVAEHRLVESVDLGSWHANIDTNLAACVWACRTIAGHMRKRATGSILIVGSTSVYTPRASEALYRVSKAGLKAFMEVLAIELAPAGVRVNMLTPGSFRTGLTQGVPPDVQSAVEREIPLGRTAVPIELTATALLLLSDAVSPYTTGSDFIVDGGLHLRPIR